MPSLIDLVVLLAAVAVVAAAARRLGLLAPVVLVVAGIVLSFVPGFPDYRVDPELVLFAILPVLLHAAALQTSLPAFRANLRPIALLAVGLVVVTAVVVGLVLHAVVPSIPLPVACALGAVVAPPDAIAATAIARKVGLPRRMVTILEGESLINDATALVLFRVAVAASVGEAIGWAEGLLQFVVAAAGGVLVGLAVGQVLTVLHRLTDEPLLDNTLSILTPFVAFIPAEQIHASGVVAVVVSGLMLGHRAPTLMNAASRLQMDAFWRVAEFLLQGTVFLLVGLQLRGLLQDLPGGAGRTAVWASLAVLGTVVVVRLVWVYPATYLARLVPRIRERDPAPPLRVPTVIGWAGMRGVVTMGAAAALPLETESGDPFPARDLLQVVAYAVVLGTLLLQGTTLAWLTRRLRIPPDDPTIDALAEAEVRREARKAAEDRLAAVADGLPESVRARLRDLVESLDDRVWERLSTAGEPPSVAYARARRSMLAAEREVFLRARDENRIHDDVLRRVQRDFDLEDALLVEEEDGLTGGSGTPGRDTCAHLAEDSGRPDVEPRRHEGQDGCNGCRAEGRDDWVSLRLCRTCGHVGCCDSSPRRHATAHFAETEHPVMRSHEPGETWRWCYLDEVVG